MYQPFTSFLLCASHFIPMHKFSLTAYLLWFDILTAVLIQQKKNGYMWGNKNNFLGHIFLCFGIQYNTDTFHQKNNTSRFGITHSAFFIINTRMHKESKCWTQTLGATLQASAPPAAPPPSPRRPSRGTTSRGTSPAAIVPHPLWTPGGPWARHEHGRNVHPPGLDTPIDGRKANGGGNSHRRAQDQTAAVSVSVAFKYIYCTYVCGHIYISVCMYNICVCGVCVHTYTHT